MARYVIITQPQGDTTTYSSIVLSTPQYMVLVSGITDAVYGVSERVTRFIGNTIALAEPSRIELDMHSE